MRCSFALTRVIADRSIVVTVAVFLHVASSALPPTSAIKVRIRGGLPIAAVNTHIEGVKPPSRKPRNENKVTVANLSRFVTTRGGLYCFLPSITAIKWMAQNGGSSNPWTIPTA